VQNFVCLFAIYIYVKLTNDDDDDDDDDVHLAAIFQDNLDEPAP